MAPRITHFTVQDAPEKSNLKELNLKGIVPRFALLAIVVGAAGFTLAKVGITIADNTGLSESFVGMLFTAVATSLPELIVSIAAVKQKALTLSVGNSIGGNSFDVLFVAFADIACSRGSILHAVSNSQVFIVSLTIFMTSILIPGLLYRQKGGFGKIGWESLLIILAYLTGNAFLFFPG